MGFRIDDEDLEDLKTVRDAVDYVEVQAEGELIGSWRVPGSRPRTLARGHRARSRTTPRSSSRSPTRASPPSTTSTSNERLEFLGDAVVGLVIAEHAFRELDLPEGGLAQVRQATVSATVLAAASRAIGIDEALRLGRGEEASGGEGSRLAARRRLRGRRGAVYLREGLEAARARRARGPSTSASTEAQRPGRLGRKSRLQEWAEANGLGTPSYEVTGDGPGHDAATLPPSRSQASVAGTGEGSSKKAAELAAARAAWEGEMPELPEVETVRAVAVPRAHRQEDQDGHGHQRQADPAPQDREGVPLAPRRATRSSRSADSARTSSSGSTRATTWSSTSGCPASCCARRARRTRSRSTPTSSSPSQPAASCATWTRGCSASSTSRSPRQRASRSTSRPTRRLAVGGDGVALRGRVPELADLGIDPVEDVVGWDRFAAILRDRTTPLKALITDQHVIAGSGTSTPTRSSTPRGLRYDRPSGSLSTIEVRRLHRSIGEVLAEAIKHGGEHASPTSSSSTPTASPAATRPSTTSTAATARRATAAARPIQKVTVRGRATYFCPNCQA